MKQTQLFSSPRINKFRDFVERQKWTFAKTYESFAPHEYVVKPKLPFDEQKIFFEFVVFIQENGYRKKFGKSYFTYFNIDEFKYWTMGHAPSITTVLNRRKIDE